MYEEASTKFNHRTDPILSTPTVDVEEYNKLRNQPYPQQSCKNLPYYFLENENFGPRICSSDLEKLPLKKFSSEHVNKLKRMYVSLREECGFKRYLIDEKRIKSSHTEAFRVYESEISASNFRIANIKDDIAQFANYLTEAYNLNQNKFESVVEAGFGMALSSCSMINCMGAASEAMSTGANVLLFIWMCIFEFLVVRMQTYVHLTISNYANGTGYTTWTFCPYVKGFGITLVIVAFLQGLLFFCEAAMNMTRAWVSINSDKLSVCNDKSHLNFFGVTGSSALDIMMLDKQCFNEANDFTRRISCKELRNMSAFKDNRVVFSSSYYLHYVKELSNLSPTNFCLSNGLIYISTLVFWFFMTRTVKNGVHSMIQWIHRGVMLAIVFLLFSFTVTILTLKNDITKEATYTFFSVQSPIFCVEVLLMAFKRSLTPILPYYHDLGAKMPFHWNPEAVFSWKAIAHLLAHFVGMWLSYLAVFNEKYFFETKDISCFFDGSYLLNAAMPRLLNYGYTNVLAIMFFLVQSVVQCITSVTLVSMVWRNLSYNINLLKKYPQMQYAFDVICLGIVLITMIKIEGHKSYLSITQTLSINESAMLCLLVFIFDVAVFSYYGPSRVWVDIQFLTRQKVHPSIELNYIVSFSILLVSVIIILPKFMKMYLSINVTGLFSSFFLPPLVMLAFAIVSESKISEVRHFHFWGERSGREQYERLRFNPAQFTTSHLRAKQVIMNDSGDEFYTDQRKKSLIRIALFLRKERE